jgi:hypothetical protein
MTRRQINAEELHSLYASIGKGIWHLQNVEDVLHTYITIKRDVKVRAGMPVEQAENILQKHRKNTLGSALKISREANIFSSQIQKRLEEFKEERDWLVHRSVYQNREDLYLEDKRYALINRIDKFAEEAIQIQKLIAEELESFVVAQGVNREWIYQQAQESINKLKGMKP